MKASETTKTDEPFAVNFVNSILRDALRLGASDIHFEREAEGLTVRTRVDGLLRKVGNLVEPLQADQVISRIKVLSKLDISEQRIPQDGRLRLFKIGNGEVNVPVGQAQGNVADFIDVRVSIMPNLDGEDAVLRILDKSHIVGADRQFRLDHLGFEKQLIASIRKLMNRPHGMFLVTGPTGSGKTTTLYAALNEMDHSTEKTITIEDPIEYRLKGVLQIPVNEKKGLSFANGLRSILRHDPDRILVGEIRDNETADIAVQAALTGHQVMTTVHANSAVNVIGRFRHMGTDLYALASGLNAVMAQRLLRRLCDHCKEPVARSDGMVGEFYKPVGCELCGLIGFRGRLAVGELLLLDDEVRRMILESVPQAEIIKVAQKSGFVTLVQAAKFAAASGLVALEDVQRIDPDGGGNAIDL